MTVLTRKRGDTFADKFVVKSKQTGLPVNIDGYSFLLTVDPEEYPEDDSNNIFQITGNVTDAASGSVEFAPSLSESDQLGNYYFDIQMIDSASKIRTIDHGKYIFTQDITK